MGIKRFVQLRFYFRIFMFFDCSWSFFLFWEKAKILISKELLPFKCLVFFWNDQKWNIREFNSRLIFLSLWRAFARHGDRKRNRPRSSIGDVNLS